MGPNLVGWGCWAVRAPLPAPLIHPTSTFCSAAPQPGLISGVQPPSQASSQGCTRSLLWRPTWPALPKGLGAAQPETSAGRCPTLHAPPLPPSLAPFLHAPLLVSVHLLFSPCPSLSLPGPHPCPHSQPPPCTGLSAWGSGTPPPTDVLELVGGYFGSWRLPWAFPNDLGESVRGGQPERVGGMWRLAWGGLQGAWCGDTVTTLTSRCPGRGHWLGLPGCAGPELPQEDSREGSDPDQLIPHAAAPSI